MASIHFSFVLRDMRFILRCKVKRTTRTDKSFLTSSEMRVNSGEAFSRSKQFFPNVSMSNVV